MVSAFDLISTESLQQINYFAVSSKRLISYYIDLDMQLFWV